MRIAYIITISLVFLLPLYSSNGDITISRTYQIPRAFTSDNRERTLAFDFRSLLAGIPESDIKRVDWIISHSNSQVNVQLSSNFVSGARGNFTLTQYVSTGSTTLGFAIPRPPSSGTWFYNQTQEFNFSQPESPVSFSILPSSSTQFTSEVNKENFAKYYQPFDINVLAYQGIEVLSTVFAMPPASASQTPSVYTGAVTVTIVLYKPALSNLTISPPHILNPARISCSVSNAHPGGLVRLQSSENPANPAGWVQIASGSASSEGIVDFTDIADSRPSSGLPKCGFFRAVSEPILNP